MISIISVQKFANDSMISKEDAETLIAAIGAVTVPGNSSYFVLVACVRNLLLTGFSVLSLLRMLVALKEDQS